MAALEAGYDLGGLAGCVVLIALLSIVSWTFARLADVLDVSIFGFHPFAGIARAIENTIVAGCNVGIKALEGTATRFFSGLIDSLGIFVGLAVLLGQGVKAALAYLWGTALGPLIERAVSPVRRLAQKAEADALTASRDLAREAGRLDDKIAATASALVAKLTRELTAAVARSEAVVEGDIGRVAGDLRNLTDRIPWKQIAETAGGLVLLKALVDTIAREAGLDNAECRDKVKQVCNTPADEWLALLAGAAFLEGELSLRALVPPARVALHELTDAIKLAA